MEFSGFSVFIELCNYQRCLTPEHVCHSQKELCARGGVTPPPPPVLLSQATTHLPSVSVQDSDCRWKHITRGPSCRLLSLSVMFCRFVYVVTRIGASFPLLPKVFHCMYVFHISLFTHSWTFGFVPTLGLL